MYNNLNYLTVGELNPEFLNKIQNYQKYILILLSVHNFNEIFLKYNEFKSSKFKMRFAGFLKKRPIH